MNEITTSEFRTISAGEAKAWIGAGNTVLVDVREPQEFSAEHAAQAISVPLSRLRDIWPKLDLPAGSRVLFQCQKGKRGEQACLAASALPAGPSVSIFNVAGGIEALKQAGVVTVAAGSGHGISIFRQVQMVVGALVLAFVLVGFAGFTWGFALAGLFGAALAVAGLTGFCGLALLLARAPWNKG